MPQKKQMIRPVGNRFITRSTPLKPDLFAPYHVQFYQSGTAALSAAICTSIQHKAINAKNAEVIIPAYACPDLISAIVYTGAKPIPVDLCPDRPWMNANQITEAINEHTCAIIAVNFLGIFERMDKLADIAMKNNIILIGDSAQAFPKKDLSDYWQGDLNIISFGRGKPVNLLGGGALIYADTFFTNYIPNAMPANNGSLARLKYILKQKLFNIVTLPTVYSLLTRLPGLHIGETIYKPLHGIAQMADANLKYLNANVEYYRDKKEISPALAQIFKPYADKIIDLATITGQDTQQPFLRYPVLVKNGQRDRIYDALSHLGVSKMYQKPLADIDGVKAELAADAGPFPNAVEFAKNLLTFPTHDGISDEILAAIKLKLSEILD